MISLIHNNIKTGLQLHTLRFTNWVIGKQASICTQCTERQEMGLCPLTMKNIVYKNGESESKA